MQLVLSAALPDPGVARELAKHVAEQAPTLTHWLEHARVHSTPSPAADTWCTALEHWQLLARGFAPTQDQHISAGLGPLRSTGTDDEPVWLAELVHMAPSRDGAALLPARGLEITAEQAEALLASAQPDLRSSGIKLQAERADTWRVRWDEPVAFPCASPELVAVSSVNDWWPQAIEARPWRRLVNSLQMAWFEHPVNQARAAAGQPPINSLWLYGGARRSQLTHEAPPDLRIERALQPLADRQDWAGWIAALSELERTVFQPMASEAPTLVLTGRTRFVQLQPRTGWVSRWRRHDWRSWWGADQAAAGAETS